MVEEELRVGKREVGRGSVRVRSYVTERPVEEQVELRQEHVTIERRPVDRELAAGEAAFQERTIEAVERGEEAVVSKTARVTEEIGLRKDVERETETVRDTVRKQDVEIEDDRAGHIGRPPADPKVNRVRRRPAGRPVGLPRRPSSDAAHARIVAKPGLIGSDLVDNAAAPTAAKVPLAPFLADPADRRLRAVHGKPRIRRCWRPRCRPSRRRSAKARSG